MDKLPTTFEEAVDYVAERIDNNTVTDTTFHFTAGMSIRNCLGLWHRDNPLHQDMLKRFGLSHADDTCHIIAQAAHAKKNGFAYSPDADIKRFKQHWQNLGLDPARA